MLAFFKILRMMSPVELYIESAAFWDLHASFGTFSS